jgi:hypothetical protein
MFGHRIQHRLNRRIRDDAQHLGGSSLLLHRLDRAAPESPRPLAYNPTRWLNAENPRAIDFGTSKRQDECHLTLSQGDSVRSR